MVVRWSTSAIRCRWERSSDSSFLACRAVLTGAVALRFDGSRRFDSCDGPFRFSSAPAVLA